MSPKQAKALARNLAAAETADEADAVIVSANPAGLAVVPQDRVPETLPDGTKNHIGLALQKASDAAGLSIPAYMNKVQDEAAAAAAEKLAADTLEVCGKVHADRKDFAQGSIGGQYNDAVLFTFLSVEGENGDANRAAYVGRTASHAYFKADCQAIATRLRRAMDGKATTTTHKSRVEVYRDLDGHSVATDLRRLADAIEDLVKVRVERDLKVYDLLDDESIAGKLRLAYVTAHWDTAVSDAREVATETAKACRTREPLEGADPVALESATVALRVALASVRGDHKPNDDDALQGTLKALRDAVTAFNAVTQVRADAFDF